MGVIEGKNLPGCLIPFKPSNRLIKCIADCMNVQCQFKDTFYIMDSEDIIHCTIKNEAPLKYIRPPTYLDRYSENASSK